MPNLAVIGMGRRAGWMVERFAAIAPEFKVVAAADPNVDAARANLRNAGVDDGVGIFSDGDDLLQDADRYDALLIGSSCHLHTPLAVKAAETGLPLFLEKPVSVSYEQATQLRDAYRGREKTVVVSFPLRVTPLFRKVMEIVESGRLGTINQVQAINNVPYGWVYYGRPVHREYGVSGGLWLQKTTHDFDYLNQILGRATAVTAMMSRTVYGGDMPQDLMCSACDLAETCAESPQNMNNFGTHEGLIMADHPCVFGSEIMNQDAGSALVQYESGIHASYTQNFVTRKSAATRGAIVTGYEATLSFDWYTHTITVTDHHGEGVEEFEIRATTGHLGGDDALIENFRDVCLGRDESKSDLSAGITSVLMCLAARESAHRQSWVPISPIDAPQFPQHVELAATPSDLEPA
jgi:predicted dehydrogenase